jgi:hypothetical protein
LPATTGVEPAAGGDVGLSDAGPADGGTDGGAAVGSDDRIAVPDGAEAAVWVGAPLAEHPAVNKKIDAITEIAATRGTRGRWITTPVS